MKEWSFLTSHGAVISYIARNNRAKAADIAAAVGITERSVRKIIADLEREGYFVKRKEGRNNTYKLNLKTPFKCPISNSATVDSLFQIFN